jgi:tRNA threonylcarbamoyladenosine biosynthesis protein TsaB
MNILAFDTSTQYLCVGLAAGKAVFGFQLAAGRALSELMAATLERIMEAAGLEFGALDYIACGAGPGSFTGVRIGMSCAKALSFCHRTPVVPVRSLDILARGAGGVSAAAIIPVIDARRGMVYWSVYRRAGAKIRRVSPYALGPVTEAVARAPRGSVFTGDGLGIYRGEIARRARAPVFLEKDFWYPQPHLVLACAREAAAGRSVKSAFDVRPEYLYPMDCQVRILEKRRARPA